MNGIRILPADREHLAAIPGIEIAAAAMFAEEDLPRDLRYSVTTEEDLHAAGTDGRLWVALLGDRPPVGFAMADVVDGNAHLDEMDVLPDWGRRGIGTSLLRAFLGWGRSENYRVATLITFGHVPWNAPFYEKHGFTTMREEDIGEELADLLAAEARAGLDVSKRVCMTFDLACGDQE